MGYGLTKCILTKIGCKSTKKNWQYHHSIMHVVLNLARQNKADIFNWIRNPINIRFWYNYFWCTNQVWSDCKGLLAAKQHWMSLLTSQVDFNFASRVDSIKSLKIVGFFLLFFCFSVLLSSHLLLLWGGFTVSLAHVSQRPVHHCRLSL